MSSLALIVLIRVIHVMAAVAWAGAVFMLASVLVPFARRSGTDAAHVVGVLAQRVGLVIGGSGTLAVLSGLYLFVALHRHDASAGAVVLGAGALAGILSLAIGVFVARPVGRSLRASARVAVTEQASTDAALHALRLRTLATVSARVMAALLGLAVISMATFRFAQLLV
jgi:uncharacterized membrane protein